MAWDAHTFNAMTPSQHLSRAKTAMERTDVAEWAYALRHIRAVPPNSPEAVEATAIATELDARLEAFRRANAAGAAEAKAAAAQAKSARASAVRELQVRLKDLGYDLTVAEAGSPDEVAITSNDFDDTDHRVGFLSFMRGRNSPAVGACVVGFQSVRLKSSDFFFGFSESYPLDCFSLR
jgi:hypothetical protein